MSPRTTSSLSFFDMVILSLILFAIPIYSSWMMYWDVTHMGNIAHTPLSFNELANHHTLMMELGSLGVAGIYLFLRSFDFRALNLQFNRHTLPLTLLLIVCAGLTADVYQYLHYFFFPHHFPETPIVSDASHYTPLFILVSLLNGFYEEIFFMGLIFVVHPKILPHMIGLSLIVRFAFHTYQGLASAFTITTLGVVFLLFRRKTNMLLPFILAHGFFDIFGLSLLRWFV